jgi:probable rRNA maturation factor
VKERLLTVQNRTRRQWINVRLLRWMIRGLLEDILNKQEFDVSVFLVSRAGIERLNLEILAHPGPTDVISLDHGSGLADGFLCGEVYACTEEAIAQARRFRTDWQRELVRYIVHGILHLNGFDDTTAAARRLMRQKESACLKALARRYSFLKLNVRGAKAETKPLS